MATANTITKRPQGKFARAAKVALVDQGLSVTQLARELGFARNTVSIAINHDSMLPTVKQAIASHLNIPIP